MLKRESIEGWWEDLVKMSGRKETARWPSARAQPALWEITTW